MESENLSKKAHTPGAVGFYTQINNPVDSVNLGFPKKGDRHAKHMSEFNLPHPFPDSNYYQLSRPKKKSLIQKTKSQKEPHGSKNFYSMQKKAIIGTKSTHSSMIKRNRQKKKKTVKAGKKGNSVVAVKSQGNFNFSGSVKRNYKQKGALWRKEKPSRSRKKRSEGKKAVKRKRRGTFGVQSVKVEKGLTHSVYSREHYKGSNDIHSMKKIHPGRRKKAAPGELYSKKRENSYLTSSEMSEMFEHSVDIGRNVGQKWGSTQGVSDRFSENFSGTHVKPEYGSEKMDFFQARLNEIQSKYISSGTYQLK